MVKLEDLDISIRRYIESLNHSVTGFWVAKSLLDDLILRRPNHVQSLAIPARDAAMQLYHFSQTLDQMSRTRSEELQRDLDRKLLRETQKEFQNSFPNTSAMRGLIGHASTSLKRRNISQEAVREVLHSLNPAGVGQFRTHYGNICEGFSQKTYVVVGTGTFYISVDDSSFKKLQKIYLSVREAAGLP